MKVEITEAESSELYGIAAGAIIGTCIAIIVVSDFPVILSHLGIIQSPYRRVWKKKSVMKRM